MEHAACLPLTCLDRRVHGVSAPAVVRYQYRRSFQILRCWPAGDTLLPEVREESRAHYRRGYGAELVTSADKRIQSGTSIARSLNIKDTLL